MLCCSLNWNPMESVHFQANHAICNTLYSHGFTAEHFVYTEDVGGSNPSLPTRIIHFFTLARSAPPVR